MVIPYDSCIFSGAGKRPNVSHHPTIGDTISNRYLFWWWFQPILSWDINPKPWYSILLVNHNTQGLRRSLGLPVLFRSRRSRWTSTAVRSSASWATTEQVPTVRTGPPGMVRQGAVHSIMGRNCCWKIMDHHQGNSWRMMMWISHLIRMYVLMTHIDSWYLMISHDGWLRNPHQKDGCFNPTSRYWYSVFFFF